MIDSPLFQGLGLPSGMPPTGPGDGNDGMKHSDAPPLPLYVPKDTVKKIRINDNRHISPTTGRQIKEGKSANVDPEAVAAIVRHAKAKGIDPYTALAVSYQETGLGSETGTNELGQAPMYYPDDNLEGETEQNANRLVKAIQDKLSYAKQLGFDKKGEAFALQAYNGYGKLKPRFKGYSDSFYGIPVTDSDPLDMKKNPAYGKTVVSLRDEVLKKHPEIVKIVENTPAYNPANKSTAQAWNQVYGLRSPALAGTTQ